MRYSIEIVIWIQLNVHICQEWHKNAIEMNVVTAKVERLLFGAPFSSFVM